MKRISSWLAWAALAPAAVAGCGGGVDAGPADEKFQANAPTFDQAALQIDDADANPISAATLQTTSDQQALSSDRCHPHLFSRTHEIVGRLNRHTNKLLRRVKALIAHHPNINNGTT